MLAVGILLALGFVGDAIDYFFFEDPSEFSVSAELLWLSLFLLMVAGVEGVLWLAFRTYNAKYR